MAVYRTKGEELLKNYGETRQSCFVVPDEWRNQSDHRDLDPTWENRYRYEAGLILGISNDFDLRKMIELGSGPGRLGEIIQETDQTVIYSFIDKPGAKEVWESRNGRGTFHIKDMMNGLDVSGLDTDYDMVIANDFLEHVSNPSDILYKLRSITKEKSVLFVSVPNWRMGHGFTYRGLFDFDNWVYFCKLHGWVVKGVAPSPLKCNESPKLDSEQTMPDSLITSWNWYFVCEKLPDNYEATLLPETHQP